MVDLLTDPCPDRIIQDTGFGFCMGAIGGSVIYFPKGLYNYNSLRGARFIGGVEAVRMNVPRLAGTFASWAAIFSTFDCAFVYARKKEDPWNSILSGAAGGGFLSLRQGFGPMGRSVLGTAAFFGLMEGVYILFVKTGAPMIEEAPLTPHVRAHLAQQGAAPAWFGALFRGKKGEVKSSYMKDEVVESFDSSMPSNFDFN